MLFSGSAVDRFKWEEFIKSHTFCNPYQSPEFYDFFNSVPGYSAEVLAIGESGRLNALCVVTFQKENGIKGFFSRRAIIYGGVIAESKEALSQLLDAVNKALKHKVIYMEVRNAYDYSESKAVFAEKGWAFTPHLNFQLSLSGKTTDQLLSAMKYNRKREIKMSLKEGAAYAGAADILEVKAVYEMLRSLYQEKVKLPLPSFAYFEKLAFLPIGKVFVVKHNGRIIGGSVCVYYPNNAIYTLYYCGERNYHKKIFPTHLAILAAMEFGVKTNLKMLDLMGAGKPGEEYGVRNYKQEFGGELVDHGRFINVCNPALYKLGTAVIGLRKKIKV